MESELFTYESSSRWSDYVMEYDNVVLLKDIAGFPAGSEFPNAEIDIHHMEVRLYDKSCRNVGMAPIKLELA